MASKGSDISSKENELIEKVAQFIVDSEMEAPAIILLQTVKPLVTIGGELGYFFLAPFLPLLEDKGYDFLDTFEKRENIEKLIRTVERRTKEKSKEKEKAQRPSLWRKLKEKLFYY